jgi:hypothetical protein
MSIKKVNHVLKGALTWRRTIKILWPKHYKSTSINFILFAITVFLSSSTLANNIVYETQWIDSEEMNITLKKMSSNRLFPCEISGKMKGIEIKYSGAYCPFLPQMNYFYSRWGMSDHWYEKYGAQYEKRGFTEYSHSVFFDLSYNVVHQATWVLIGE